MTTISVVIVVYNNTPETVAQCLASIGGNCQDVVVVDNASHQSYADVVRDYGAKLIRLGHNMGFGAAANHGAALCTGTSIFFINPDTILSPTSWNALEKAITDNPEVAAFGCQLVDHNGVIEESYGQRVTLTSLVWRHLRRSSLASTTQVVGWVSGAALLIRRNIFETLGGFDRHFFMYWEDVDLGRRLQDAGYESMYLPSVSVTHSRGDSLKGDRQRKTVYYDLSADRYFRLYYPFPLWLFPLVMRSLYRRFSPWAQ